MAGENTGSAPVPSLEETTERIRALNEQLIQAAKAAGGASLDAYEQSLANLLDFENKVAGASQLDWVSALAKAHTDFVSQVSGAYLKAAREATK